MDRNPAACSVGQDFRIYISAADGFVRTRVLDLDNCYQGSAGCGLSNTLFACRFPDVKTYTLWRLRLSTCALKQLSIGTNDVRPTCTPDGKWVIYLASESTDKIMKVSIDGGALELAHGNVFGPAISPDGHSVAYRLDSRLANRRLRKFVIQSIEGGAPVKEMDAPPFAGQIRWTPDLENLAYSRFPSGKSQLCMVPITGCPSRALASF